MRLCNQVNSVMREVRPHMRRNIESDTVINVRHVISKSLGCKTQLWTRLNICISDVLWNSL